MSDASEVMSMYEDIYEECLAEATKNMAPMGYFPHEIELAAKKWYEEKIGVLGNNSPNVVGPTRGVI
jgi:hypothetical protein|tara:strand:+ start:18 stop:218 length:201 start_codon:yes stop_codon:yes gene_type:complete